VTIQFGFKAPAFAAETSWGHAGYLYLESFIEPFGTLWFIYLLPIFFVVTKLTRKVPPPAIIAFAAGLEMADVATGWTVIARASSISMPATCSRLTYSSCRTAPAHILLPR
jgi:uncharacterized membrane protein YcfT